MTFGNGRAWGWTGWRAWWGSQWVDTGTCNSGKIWGGWGGWIWQSLGQKSGSKLLEWLTSPRKKVWRVRRESSWVQNSKGQHLPTDMPAETKTLENLVAGDVSFYSSFGQLPGEFYILRKYISFQACSHQKYKTQQRFINHIIVQKNNSFTRWECCW